MKKRPLTIALIGCSKTKTKAGPSGYIEARDLYSSELFRKRLEHIEARKLPWYVLSAKGGLIKPTTPIRTYNKTMRDLSKLEAKQWHAGVVTEILFELEWTFRAANVEEVTIELHAGEKYCEPLASLLGTLGIKTIRPVKAMGIGEQLSYYKTNTNATETVTC